MKIPPARVCRPPAPLRASHPSSKHRKQQTPASKESGLRMSESAPQSLKNHNRLDPQFHVVTFFTLVVNLIIAIVYMVHHLGIYSAWLVLLSVIVFVPYFKLRLYPLKVQ